MADCAVNYDGMDMGSAPNEALAVKPTTYRAFTNDGDFAGEVNMAYRGPVRVVDPATGDEVFNDRGAALLVAEKQAEPAGEHQAEGEGEPTAANGLAP